MVKIDAGRCRQIADVLKGMTIRDSFREREFLSFEAERETKLRLYLFSTAICHQTRTLHHPGLNLWGWDYLEYGFLQMLRYRPAFLNPVYMDTCSVNEIKEHLAVAFSPSGKPEDSTLDRLDERIRMLVELCHTLKKEYQSKASGLVDASKGMLLDRGRGLYETLARFEAFSDAQKKKITFFVKLATDSGVLYLRDPQHLIPIMDYHMMRVLLRQGCVWVEEADTQEALRNRGEMGSDHQIREASIQAMRLIAEESGHNILTMNDIFWPLGRSCCNETTLCTDRVCEKEPCTFFEIVDVSRHDHCPFEAVCRGKVEERFRKLWEPWVNTHYY